MRQRGLNLLVGGAVLSGFGCSGDSTGPPATGTLVVATTTAGPSTDSDGYTVQVDNGEGQAIGISTRLTLPPLAAGIHSVLLAGMASNCDVIWSDNPKTVTIVSGETVEAAFTIYCNHPAPY